MSRRVCSRHKGWCVWSRNPAGLLTATKVGRPILYASSARVLHRLIDAAQGNAAAPIP